MVVKLLAEKTLRALARKFARAANRGDPNIEIARQARLLREAVSSAQTKEALELFRKYQRKQIRRAETGTAKVPKQPASKPKAAAAGGGRRRNGDSKKPTAKKTSTKSSAKKPITKATGAKSELDELWRVFAGRSDEAIIAALTERYSLSQLQKILTRTKSAKAQKTIQSAISKKKKGPMPRGRDWDDFSEAEKRAAIKYDWGASETDVKWRGK